MITDLGHAAFAAKDVETSLAFYAKLGIREAFRLNHDDGSLMLIYLHVAGERFIELFPGAPESDANRKQSYLHLCLVTDDIHADVDALRKAGVTIDRDVTEGLDTNLQAWLKDPDGNAIELMQLSPDSPQKRIARGDAPE